jgi:hypothetical protein
MPFHQKDPNSMLGDERNAVANQAPEKQHTWYDKPPEDCASVMPVLDIPTLPQLAIPEPTLEMRPNIELIGDGHGR